MKVKRFIMIPREGNEFHPVAAEEFTRMLGQAISLNIDGVLTNPLADTMVTAAQNDVDLGYEGPINQFIKITIEDVRLYDEDAHSVAFFVNRP